MWLAAALTSGLPSIFKEVMLSRSESFYGLSLLQDRRPDIYYEVT